MQGPQPFKKALLLSGKVGSVLDATAGRGHDAFLMAAWGFSVRAFERNSAVWKQLETALSDLELKPNSLAHTLLHSNLSFEWGDALFSSDLPNNAFDIVYVDPMYAAKRKTAASTKEVLALRELVGSPSEPLETIIERALQIARKKVVLKRPLHEKIPFISNHSFEGSSTRYDVFLKGNALKKLSSLRLD